MMFQGSCRPTHTPEVRRPPIPHRPRGGHARHEALAWSQAAGGFHASWACQMGICRLVWNTPSACDHASASWCACTPPRGFVDRSSADFGVPITTSLCVQVPRDTGSSVSVVIFGLRHVIFGLRAVLGQLMYLRGPNTEIYLSFGLAARVCLVFSRSSPSPHRTAGGA